MSLWSRQPFKESSCWQLRQFGLYFTEEGRSRKLSGGLGLAYFKDYFQGQPQIY